MTTLQVIKLQPVPTTDREGTSDIQMLFTIQWVLSNLSVHVT